MTKKNEFHQQGMRFPIGVYKTTQKILSKRPRNEQGYKPTFNAYVIEAIRAYNEIQTNKIGKQ